jgi:hypothetical protein
MREIADAIRKITAAMQRELDAGRRSSRLDAHDLVDCLLAIADEIDPPFAPAQEADRPARPQSPSR